MLSLAVVDIDQSEPGTEVTLVWGEEGGGSAKPVVERHVQTEIRAIVGAGSLRRGRPHLVSAARSAWPTTSSWSASTGRSPGRSWCTSGASGASSTGPTAAPRRARSASAGSASGTPISSTCSRRETPRDMKQAFDDNGLARLELEFLMDWFLDPGDERRRASDEMRELLFDAAARARAHHIKVGNIPGDARLALAAHRALRRALRRGRRAHRREDRVRVHALRREREERRRRARGRRRGGRGERRHRDRHLAHVQARHRARRAAPDPARVHVLGRAERRPVRRHGRSRSTRPSTTATSPARASSTCAATSRSARITGTPGRGASRCSPRSFATTRSTSSSGGRTRRPPPNSQTREELRMSAPWRKELDRDRLVWMYQQMLRIREFEERVKRTFVEHPGVIRGHTHLADGAEASIVGSIATLGPEDQFFTTYRCHGYPIARGTDSQGDDGRDLRPQGRALQGHRRLDAPRPTSRTASSAPRGSSAPGSRTRPAPPGRRRSASRARSSSASSATAPPSRARSPRR